MVSSHPRRCQYSVGPRRYPLPTASGRRWADDSFGGPTLFWHRRGCDLRPWFGAQARGRGSGYIRATSTGDEPAPSSAASGSASSGSPRSRKHTLQDFVTSAPATRPRRLRPHRTPRVHRHSDTGHAAGPAKRSRSAPREWVVGDVQRSNSVEGVDALQWLHPPGTFHKMRRTWTGYLEELMALQTNREIMTPISSGTAGPGPHHGQADRRPQTIAGN